MSAVTTRHGRAIEPGRTVDASRNLLDQPWLRGLLRSRWYPAIVAYPTLVVFGYIVYSLLWGPAAASANLGSNLTWVLWWPLIPLFMFALGRFWCAICPFGTLIDQVQRFAGLGMPAPAFLKRYGIWIIDALFIFITWADHAWGIVESPRGSGYLLGLMVTAVVATAVWYERRVFCRYLCFLGGLSGNYSRTSGIALLATPDICAKCATLNCYRGDSRTPGCPVFEFPRAMQTMANCNFCANCIKACPHDSIRLVPRAPTHELWFIARPRIQEAFLAVVIVGIVLVQNVTMLEFWEPTLRALTGALFDNRLGAFTIIFVAAMAAPFAVTLAASGISRRATRESLGRNFTRFAYAVIPLDLAGHVAHNLYHLLSEGGAIVANAGAAAGFAVIAPTALLEPGVIQALQFLVVGLGIAGAMFTAAKIADRAQLGVAAWRIYWPHLVALGLFGVLNLYLFTLPMSHRV